MRLQKFDICALHIAYYCVPITNYIKDLMFGIQSKCPNQKSVLEISESISNNYI